MGPTVAWAQQKAWAAKKSTECHAACMTYSEAPVGHRVHDAVERGVAVLLHHVQLLGQHLHAAVAARVRALYLMHHRRPRSDMCA